MIEISLLGTGSPIPDPNRAGPSTLIRAGGQVFLVVPGQEDQWRTLAASEFGGRVELGDDLHRVEVEPRL
jgi:ribonuclease Z